MLVNAESEHRDREIEDLREDIGWLQKRITEINLALDETRKTMKVLAETVQFHNRQVSRARADNELHYQRNQELRCLIRDGEWLQ